MQTYDAYMAVQKGQYAAGGIALGIALVQLPDVMGWLFGEIMKIGFVIAAVDYLNEKVGASLEPQLYSMAPTLRPAPRAHFSLSPVCSSSDSSR